MGSRIQATGVALPPAAAGGSIDLEAQAAGGCLHRAGVDANDVGILINAGVYRDDHMVEPAVSSFIQRGIGANEMPGGARSTFSFDLSNGGCGMLTAMMVADGLLRSGVTRHALVVAGDGEPVAGESDGYDYVPAAAAVLLTAGPGDDGGLMAFRSDAVTSRLASYGGRIEWPGGETPRRRLVMRAADAYPEECLEAALASLTAFLLETSLTLPGVDLLIPSQSPPGFVAGLREGTGLGDRVVDVTGDHGNVHTAGIGVALDRVVADGRFAAARHVVFLTVGAGIATSVALYAAPR